MARLIAWPPSYILVTLVTAKAQKGGPLDQCHPTLMQVNMTKCFVVLDDFLMEAKIDGWKDEL